MYVRVESVILVFCVSIVTNFGNCVPLQNQYKGNTRIGGGNTAPPGAFPFQISLRDNGNVHFCGGALISERWVLTAASCVYGKAANQILIVAGADSIRDGTIYTCENITRHEQFNVNTRAYDIAVVKTSKDVLNSTFVAPTFYYRSTTTCNTNYFTTSGWGDTESGSAEYLQYLNVTAITNIGCQALLFTNNYTNIVLTTQNICALGSLNTDSSICVGDRGGPLYRSQTRVVLGIVSSATCGPGIPAVYTQTGSFEPWIRAQTGVPGVSLV